jgi:TolB-like protein/class 3 adenylate cyclase
VQRVERRLAAILAADVAGYSRLMGADEAGTARRLRDHHQAVRPVVAEHGGRIVKTTGDGLLLEFPSVVAAVECAVAVQALMAERNAGLVEDQRMLFRMGVNLGDVLIEGDDILGEGVNVAARLEGIAHPGQICISDAAYQQVRGKIAIGFVDLGEKEMKNIALPVRVYRVQLGDDGAALPRAIAARAHAPSPQLGGLRKPLVWAGAALVVLLLVIAGGARYFLGASRTAPAASNLPASTAATHLSIVVLPFTNLSNDPSQDYFADGITDNLTTDLSRIRNSFVIARNTAFTYKGKSIDAKEIGKELGVRYMLEGSVQRDQNRVRVNAQLIDAESGTHLWAERFEENVADLFKLQDQVVARLANTLGNELLKAEAEKSSRSKNPDTIDLDMRGQLLLQQQFPQPKDNIDAARDWFEQALAINPNDADALAGEAYADFVEFGGAGADHDTDHDAKILDQADRAIALAPDNWFAYYVKSLYLQSSRRSNEALGAADAGLAINPNYAVLYGARSNTETWLGRLEQAKSDAQQALRLSPRDPRIGYWHFLLGAAEFGQGHYDASIDEDHTALDAGYRFFYVYADLAAALALEGKVEEAKTALAEARRLNPNLTVKWVIATAPTLPPHLEGLRKAGLPEE